MLHNFHKSGVQITNQVFVRLRCQRSEIIVRESKPNFFSRSHFKADSCRICYKKGYEKITNDKRVWQIELLNKC